MSSDASTPAAGATSTDATAATGAGAGAGAGSAAATVGLEAIAARRPKYRMKFEIGTHKKAVSCVRFSPDGRWLASACTCAHRRYTHGVA